MAIGVAQAQPLQVATVERRPFVMQDGARLSGFSVDLWNAVAEELGESTTFVPCDTFSEMLEKVETGEVDAAIANITVTSRREVLMDFSRPMLDAGIRIAVPSDGTSGSVLVALLGRMFSILLVVTSLFVGSAFVAKITATLTVAESSRASSRCSTPMTHRSSTTSR